MPQIAIRGLAALLVIRLSTNCYNVSAADTLDHSGPQVAPLCNALASQIRAAQGYMTTEWIAGALQNDRRGSFAFDKGQPLTKGLLDKLPSKPDLENEPATLYHFGTDRTLIAINSVQGTAHCENIWLYRIVKGGAFETIGKPVDDQDGDACGVTTLFGSFTDPAQAAPPVPLYVETDDTIPRSSLSLYARQHDAWRKACDLEVSYDTKLTVGERFCAPNEACAALETLAFDLARKRDGSGTEPPTRLGDARLVAADAVKEQVDLPTFGSEGSAWNTFESNAPVYQVATPGGPLALRISHGTVGWRTNEDWLVGAYKFRGSVLEPIAGFAVAKSRTGLREVSVK